MKSVHRILFFSPHLDDVAISCGELLAAMSEKNIKTEVITFFSGINFTKELGKDAISYHDLCDLGSFPIIYRKMEDERAMKILKTDYIQLDFLECLYRKSCCGEYIYETIYDEVNYQLDENIIDQMNYFIDSYVDLEKDILVFPLGIGGHIDHKILNNIGRELCLKGGEVYFYRDVPYLKEELLDEYFIELDEILIPISYRNLYSKIAATFCYNSQIDLLWGGPIKAVNYLVQLYEKEERKIKLFCSSKLIKRNLDKLI